MKAILSRLFNHEELTRKEAKNLLLNITRGMYNDAQIAALLTVFQMRGIKVEELIGFREADVYKRQVNKITGKTVTDIIAKLVITDAEAKLKSTDLTIQEIAYSLNFPDISFFGKYFKRYTGMSPKQYREST